MKFDSDDQRKAFFAQQGNRRINKKSISMESVRNDVPENLYHGTQRHFVNGLLKDQKPKLELSGKNFGEFSDGSFWLTSSKFEANQYTYEHDPKLQTRQNTTGGKVLTVKLKPSAKIINLKDLPIRNRNEDSIRNETIPRERKLQNEEAKAMGYDAIVEHGKNETTIRVLNPKIIESITDEPKNDLSNITEPKTKSGSIKLQILNQKYKKTGFSYQDAVFPEKLNFEGKRVFTFSKYTDLADFLDENPQLKNHVMFVRTPKEGLPRKVFFGGGSTSIENYGFV